MMIDIDFDVQLPVIYKTKIVIFILCYLLVLYVWLDTSASNRIQVDR